MNTEQLKLILETLNNAGDGAYQIAIAYLIAGIVPYLLLFCGAVIFMVVAVRIIKFLIVQSREKENVIRGWREICLILNERHASYLPTESETSRVVAKVHNLIDTSNKQ